MRRFFTQMVVFNLIIIAIVLGQSPMPLRHYDLGDWLTIKNCNYVTSVTESNDYVFFGTLGGIIPYQKFNEYEEPAYTTSDGLLDDHIKAIYFDNDSRTLWAVHRKGVSRLGPVSERWENFSRDENALGNISSLGALMQKGPISLDGIYNIDPGFILQPNGVVKDNEFREYDLNLMYVNSLKDIYGGIFGLGYITGTENLKMLNLHPSGILKNYVNAFAMSEDFMWAAGIDDKRGSENDRTGISEFDFLNQSWKYYEDYSIHELVSGKIYDMSYSENKLAVATLEGVSILDLNENDWIHFDTFSGLWDNDIHCILIDQDIVLAGSEFGLNEINLKSGEVKRIYLTGEETITKIHKIENSDKYYWVGTNDGIFSIEKKTGNIKHFDFYGREIEKNRRVASNCYGISADENIVVFKGDNFFMKYNMKTNKWDNLPDYDQESGINDLDLFGQYLWIGTDKGARFMNIDTEEWEKYSYVDGLAGDRVFKVYIDGDWVWFGTDRGLTKYNWRKYVLE